MSAPRAERRTNALFWRLLAAFLLANVLAAVAFAVLVRPLWQVLAAPPVDLEEARMEAQSIAQIHASRGRRAAVVASRRLDARNRGFGLLLLPDGTPLQRRTPPPLERVLARFPDLGVARDGYERLPDGAIAVGVSVEVAGQRYRWFGVQRAGSPRRDARTALIVRAAVVVLALAAVSWWLSRWLSQPLRALAGVTRRLGAGELDARVPHGVLKRGDDIGALGREFNRMAEHTQGLVDARDRLLRDVSHELRSPLARLRVALELAREGSEPALDRIELESDRLDALIGQVLTLARLESGAAINRQRVDLAGLWTEAAADLAFEAGTSPGELVTLSHPSDGPVEILADATLLRAALDNLLRNAHRYAPDGQRIELTLESGDDGVQVIVRDHGPGVPAAELTAIFKPFYRTSAARDRSSGGHGVGLAIVDQVVRAHGGTVAAELPPGGGLAVTLRLPATP